MFRTAARICSCRVMESSAEDSFASWQSFSVHNRRFRSGCTSVRSCRNWQQRRGVAKTGGKSMQQLLCFTVSASNPEIPLRRRRQRAEGAKIRLPGRVPARPAHLRGAESAFGTFDQGIESTTLPSVWPCSTCSWARAISASGRRSPMLWLSTPVVRNSVSVLTARSRSAAASL